MEDLIKEIDIMKQSEGYIYLLKILRDNELLSSFNQLLQKDEQTINTSYTKSKSNYNGFIKLLNDRDTKYKICVHSNNESTQLLEISDINIAKVTYCLLCITFFILIGEEDLELGNKVFKQTTDIFKELNIKSTLDYEFLVTDFLPNLVQLTNTGIEGLEV